MSRELEPPMMLAEWLFVETVTDVRRRSHDPSARSRYELLGIAPLLRKLLLDSRSLLDVVGAARSEVPTDFRIRPWLAPEDASTGDGLPYLLRLGGRELMGGPGDPVLRKSRRFVRAAVGEAEGKPLTARDVVRYYAHVEGGVHFGTPKEPADNVLGQMAPLLLGRTTSQIEILGHLGEIVVNALTPLCEAILESPTIDTRIHRLNESGFYDGHWTAVHYEKT